MSRRSNRKNYRKDESKNKEPKTTVSQETPDSSKPETPQSGSEAKSPSNDPEWYGKDEALLRDAASFPYSYPFGEPIDYTTGSGNADYGSVSRVGSHAVPGVVTLFLKPSLSFNRNKNDPANVCANAFYTHVRYVNSGRKNYDPADLMMYALTIADLYGFIMWCQRLYGYMFTYSQRNKYISKELVRSNNVDYTNLLSNLASFRYWLNAFINKVSSFVVPADINLFKRKAFMYSGYYIENSFGNIKDQLYQFAPHGFYKFDYDDSKAGMMDYKPMVSANESGLLDVDEIIQYGEDLLGNIWGDEDFGLISGDILKAYGSNIISLGPVPEDYVITPVYDPYVLSQFKNATPCLSLAVPNTSGNIPTYTVGSKVMLAGNIYQDINGNICSSEAFKYYAEEEHPDDIQQLIRNGVAMAKLISVENPDPTPNDTIEATRLTLTCDTYVPTLHGWNQNASDVYCGDFICLYCAVSCYVDGSEDPEVSTMIGALGAATESLYPYLAAKYAPTHYICLVSGAVASRDFTNLRVASNVDNYTLVGDKEIKRLHECALLSLMHVPGVAKLVNSL